MVKIKKTQKNDKSTVTQKTPRIGKFSEKNKLNDLTGSEWTHFLCSVEVTKYSTHGDEGFSHKLRKQHPSPKPPWILKDIIEFFIVMIKLRFTL